MKYSFIASLALIGATMVSCDSVSEPDRFVPAEIVPQRAILIEEFTGQGCTNCPDGHTAIKELTAALGDSVIPIGIHASSLALNPPLGLKTETGEEYYKDAGSPALPTAIIDKQTAPLIVSDWGNAINHLIMEPTPFTVVAEAAMADDGTTYNIEVAFSSGEDYEGKLMVWILENDLVRRQLDHGTWIPDYVHNHVFRAAVTSDIRGDAVSMKAHTPQYKKYSYTISRDNLWVTDNLYVVAFLYNQDGVAQVTSSPQKHN